MTDNAEQELFESISKDVEKLDEDEAEVELVKEPVDEVKPEPKPKKAKVKKAMSDTRRAQLLDNLKRGRETSLAKRRVKAEAKKKQSRRLRLKRSSSLNPLSHPNQNPNQNLLWWLKKNRSSHDRQHHRHQSQLFTTPLGSPVREAT